MQLPHTPDALSEPPWPPLIFILVIVHVQYRFDGIVIYWLKVLIEIVRYIVVSMGHISFVQMTMQRLSYFLVK